MTIKNSFDYNPFGDEVSSTYGYSNVEEERHIQRGLQENKDDTNTKMTSMLKIVLSIMITLLVLSIVVSAAIIKSSRDKALDAMKEMNTSMSTVSSVFQSQELIGKLRDQSREYGGDEKNALEVAADMGREVAKNPKQLTKEMTNSEAGIAVVPYYSLCDAMKLVPLSIDGLDTARSSCETLDVSAREMMSQISKFNNLSNSFAGFMSLGLVNKTPLPDVTT